MTYVPELQIVYYAEKGSNVLKVSLHRVPRWTSGGLHKPRRPQSRMSVVSS